MAALTSKPRLARCAFNTKPTLRFVLDWEARGSP